MRHCREMPMEGEIRGDPARNVAARGLHAGQNMTQRRQLGVRASLGREPRDRRLEHPPQLDRFVQPAARCAPTANRIEARRAGLNRWRAHGSPCPAGPARRPSPPDRATPHAQSASRRRKSTRSGFRRKGVARLEATFEIAVVRRSITASPRRLGVMSPTAQAGRSSSSSGAASAATAEGLMGQNARPSRTTLQPRNLSTRLRHASIGRAPSQSVRTRPPAPPAADDRLRSARIPLRAVLPSAQRTSQGDWTAIEIVDRRN